MIKFKQKLKKSFSLASNTYDKVAYIQNFSAMQLTDFLIYEVPDFYPKSILDLGTGTGNMIIYLSKLFPNSNYTLNDISENMLYLAKQKFANSLNVNTILGDLENTKFHFHELCVSNFALQWCNNIYTVLEQHYNNSKVFAFTCLLNGTFNELNNIYNKIGLSSPVNYYPTEVDLQKFLCSLKPKKYVFYSQLFNIKYENIKEFFKYLKALGARIGNSSIQSSFLKEIIAKKEVFNTNYNVFFAVMVRE